MAPWTLLIFQIIAAILLVAPSQGEATDFEMAADFYSETQYDSRFDGAVTDSRFRNYFHLLDKRLTPYLGLHFTRDLSNGGAPKAIENAVMPVVGVQAKILRSPYLIAFAEKRLIFRTEAPTGQWQGDEFRYGLVSYYKKDFYSSLFLESYGEWVLIDRVDPEKGVLAAWLKFGSRYHLNKRIYIDPFTEVFSRQSPDLGYGPTENEWRVGARAGARLFGFNIMILGNHALYSDIKPGGFDALLVLSHEID